MFPGPCSNSSKCHRIKKTGATDTVSQQMALAQEKRFYFISYFKINKNYLTVLKVFCYTCRPCNVLKFGHLAENSNKRHRFTCVVYQCMKNKSFKTFYPSSTVHRKKLFTAR